MTERRMPEREPAARTVFIAATAGLITAFAAKALGANASAGGPTSQRWSAWLGGAIIALVPAILIFAVLSIPSFSFEGARRMRLFRATRVTLIAGIAIMLLDDHILDHPGTPPPTGISIPSPYQDYLNLLLLLVYALLLIAAAVTLPSRFATRQSQAN